MLRISIRVGFADSLHCLPREMVQRIVVEIAVDLFATASSYLTTQGERLHYVMNSPILFKRPDTSQLRSATLHPRIETCSSILALQSIQSIQHQPGLLPPFENALQDHDGTKLWPRVCGFGNDKASSVWGSKASTETRRTNLQKSPRSWRVFYYSSNSIVQRLRLPEQLKITTLELRKDHGRRAGYEEPG
jgi:hypothetical protein